MQCGLAPFAMKLSTSSDTFFTFLPRFLFPVPLCDKVHLVSVAACSLDDGIDCTVKTCSLVPGAPQLPRSVLDSLCGLNYAGILIGGQHLVFQLELLGEAGDVGSCACNEN